MNVQEFDRVYDAFLAFHARFAPLFGRREAREHSERYVRALLVLGRERRSAENLAEVVEGATARTLQLFLSASPWSARAVIDELQAYLGACLDDPESGVLIFDESGFAKQGTKSVGVARQYSGTLGKVGNCQVGVFLTYHSRHGVATVDGRLFLPEQWSKDPERCRAAGVPESEIRARSKPELAVEMLFDLGRVDHLHARWVTADEVYGNSPLFRDAVVSTGRGYVVDVACDTRVFVEEAPTEVPPYRGRGPKPRKRRLVSGAAPAVEVREVLAALPESAWHEIEVGEGSQGVRSYRFARLPIWECRDSLPGRTCWLLLRTNLDGREPRYSLGRAPAGTGAELATLARVQTTRWSIETEFETLKQEVGLDEYEVRSWRGWHHHITLSLLAGAFLLSLQQEWGEKGAPDHASAGRPRATRDPAAAPLVPRGVARLAGADAAKKPSGRTESFQTAPPTETLPAARAA